MSNGVNDLYEFGSFRLESDTGTLWRGDDVVSLSPKAGELLKLLVSRKGQVVTKQEILQTVWAGTFVEDGVLTQNIYTLRLALGPDENGRQFIETIPRRGYRFAGEVRVASVGKEVQVANGRNVGSGEDYDELSAELLEEDPKLSFYRGATSAENATPTVSASPAKGRPPFLFPTILVVLTLLGLGAAGFGLFTWISRLDGKSASSVAPIEQLRFQSLTDTGDVIHPTISPDGTTLAFVRVADEESSVWVKQIATGNSIQILPPSRKGYRSLAFSSNGTYLFFRETADPGAIYQTSPLGGTPKKVAENVWSDFSISPDDKQFAFFRRDPARDLHLLILSNTDGSGERELSSRPWLSGYRESAPAWSPDGTMLAVAGASKTEARPLLLTVDLASGLETELTTPRWRDVTRILWMPDGKHLIAAARAADEGTSQVWMLDYPDGNVRRLTNDLESYFWLSFSADGRMLVTRQQRILSHLWLFPGGDIKKAKQLTFGGRNTDGYVGLAWTPDGKIVYSSRSGHITDLHSIDPNSGEHVQLTSNSGPDNAWPAVSRDGRYIAFTSHRTGARQIWLMDADGRNQKQLTVGQEPRETAYSAALSADGSQIYFIRLGAGPSSVWKIPVNGGTAVPVSHLTNATAEGFLSSSPDGKWLAFQYVAAQSESRGEQPTLTLGILPSDGNAEPHLFDLPMRRPMIQWSSDSTAFDYFSGAFNSSSLLRQPLAGGPPQKLLDFPDRVFNFAWSLDGKDLAVARGHLQGDAVLITNLP